MKAFKSRLPEIRELTEKLCAQKSQRTKKLPSETAPESTDVIGKLHDLIDLLGTHPASEQCVKKAEELLEMFLLVEQ